MGEANPNGSAAVPPPSAVLGLPRGVLLLLKLGEAGVVTAPATGDEGRVLKPSPSSPLNPIPPLLCGREGRAELLPAATMAEKFFSPFTNLVRSFKRVRGISSGEDGGADD